MNSSTSKESQNNLEAKLFFFQILQGISDTPKESQSNLEAKLFPKKQEKPKPESEIRIWFPINLEELDLGQPEEEKEKSLPSSEYTQPKTIYDYLGEKADRDEAIHPAHRKEWENSGVHPDIIDLNLQSITDDEGAYEVLLYSKQIQRTNPGKASAGTLRRYEHLEHGGWFCQGLDPLNNWELMQWGCLKPNSPRQMPDGKTIKYEHPPKEPTRAFFLRVSPLIWEKISEAYKVPIGVYTNFWQWGLDHPQLPITITEGVKKAAALLSIGVIAVAIPGIYSGYRRHRNEVGQPIGDPFLIPELALLCPQNSEVKRPINFVFDQDTKRTTRENVKTAISITGKLFAKANCEVSVTEWNPKLGKGVDDVLVSHGRDRVNAILKNADSLDIWSVKQLSKLTYPADVTVDRQYLTEKCGDDFLIPNELIPPKSCQLLLIKSPKNTGKTELLRSLVAPFLRDGRKVLLITHRVQLGQNLCDRVGIPYVVELKLSEEGRLLGFGLCHHSMHSKSSAKFDPHEFEGAVIIVDELVQVLWDMLHSPLIASKQVEILSNFKECIRYALSTGGMLIGCDADLNDWAVDHLHKLIGFNVKQHLIVNEWKPAIENRWEVFNYAGKTPIALIQNLVEHIENGGKPFVLCTSQDESSQWSTQNLEGYLKARYPELKILRIDSESIADPTHPAYGCTSKLNEILPNYQVVLASTTLETGVDIKVKGHFDSVWGYFWGVNTCDGVRQFLARLRQNVPRHIWVNKIGLTQVGRGETTPQALWKTTDTVFRGAVTRLMSAGFDSEFDDNFQAESLNAFCKRGALINLQNRKYREVVLDAIESEGHQLIDASEVYKFDADELKALDAELKAFRDGFYLEHREKVAAIGSPDDAEFDKLKRSKVRTKDELRKYEKGRLERLYQVEVTPDLVLKDDNGWHPKIKLQYHLTLGRKFVEAKDKSAASNHLKNGDGKVWKPTFNKRQIGLKVDFLEKMGILNLFELKEIRAKDVMQIIEFGKQYSNDLRAVGITANWEDKPIAVTKNLLGNLFGLSITRVRREGQRGNQEWVYSQVAADFQRDDEGQLLLDESGLPIPVSDGREEVFKQWLISDIAKAEALEKVEVAAPSKATTPIAEVAEVDEPNPYQDLADSLAAAGSLEGVRALVDEWGFEPCDTASAFAPIETRGQLSQWLREVKLNPVAPVEEAIATIDTQVATVVNTSKQSGAFDEGKTVGEATIRETGINPESMIGKAISYFSSYQNKLVPLGRIKAIDSITEVVESRVSGIKRKVVSFITTTGDYLTDGEIAKGVYQIA